jgi:hypothetical protein
MKRITRNMAANNSVNQQPKRRSNMKWINRSKIMAVSIAAMAVAIVNLPLAVPTAVAQIAFDPCNLGGCTVIGFDDLAAGTVVSTQYETSGLDLDSRIPTLFPLVITTSARAFSSPNVLDISYGRPNELPGAYVEGIFTDGHHSIVRVRVGSQNGDNVSMIAYDLSDNVVASVTGVPPGQGAFALFQVVSDSDIARFEIASPNTDLLIDDLTFDTLTGPPVLDFSLRYGSRITLVPRGLGGTTITVRRFGGSVGDITMIIDNLPPGVSTLGPNTFTFNGPDGATANLNLEADPSAVPVRDWPVRVTGTPSPTAGTRPHTITVPLTILDAYDVRLVGIEVTQGIQGYDLPVSTSDTPISYNGVGLAAGGKTVVRVFANFAFFPPSCPAPDLICQLYGFRSDGTPLPGSPLSPENSPSLVVGQSFVTGPVRKNTNAAYNFTLPAAWTTGTISLRPVIEEPPTFEQPLCSDCCPVNNSFTLTDIAFTPTRDVLFIFPYQLLVNRGYPGFPPTVFEEARNLLPIGDTQFHMGNYMVAIDITDIWNQNVKACGFLGFSSCAEDVSGRGASVAARLKGVADDAGDAGKLVTGIFPQSDPISGLQNRIRSLAQRCLSTGFFDTQFCPDLFVFTVQNQRRPLTSVAHEFSHRLGRPHASFACGAGDVDNNGPAQDWPPDQTGRLQGVGFDRRTLGRVLFDDTTSNTLGVFYDFMSYCAAKNSDPNPKNNDPDSWISVRGWAATLGALAAGPAGASPAAAQRRLAAFQAPQAAAVPMLIVQAFVDRGNTFITKVAETSRPPTTPPPDSPYRLVVLDKSKKILSDTSMEVSEGHIDDAQMVGFLSAQVPVIGAAAIEIRENGQLIALRVRSKHAPTIKAIEVEPDIIQGHNDDDEEHGDRDKKHEGHGKEHGDHEAADAAQRTVDGPRVTIVKWTARDADQDTLMAKVDYSEDSGQTWRPLFFGPNQDGVVLRSDLFTHSKRARVRVRINDGFNETAATSQEFEEAGSPPSVRILSPVAGTTIRSAAALYLSGQAFDDSQTDIAADSLWWYAGDTLLGTGPSLSVPELPVGMTEISLVARDPQGRTTTESIAVNIVP